VPESGELHADLGRARYVIVAFVVLEILAVATGEIEGARWQRILWPFNDAGMFTTTIEVGAAVGFDTGLLSGDKQIEASLPQLLSPWSSVGRMAMMFRMKRDPPRWDEERDRGLAKAANRFRCEKGIEADAVAIYLIRFAWTDLLAGSLQPTSRTLVRRVPLPPCEPRT
jgi:hypothetical protein